MAAVNKLEVLAKENGQSPLQFLASRFYKHGGITAMARALGVSPSTIRYWMMQLDVVDRPVLFLKNTGFQLSAEGKQMISKGGQ